jgi:hypothetical protein
MSSSSLGFVESSPAATRESSLAALDDVVYCDLPRQAEDALRAAGRSYGCPSEFARHLAHARELAPGHLAVTVAEYRYHFYEHQYAVAAERAVDCLSIVAQRLGVPTDFALVTSDQADFDGDSRLARFWLGSLQAYGYVLLRLGERERGLAALQKVAELDRADRIKTRVLLEVIERAGRDDA